MPRYSAEVRLIRKLEVEGRGEPSRSTHTVLSQQLPTPLAAMRYAADHVESGWLNIGPLVEDGERLELVVKRIA